MASKPLLLMLASFLLIVSAEWEEELLTQGSTLVPSGTPAYKSSPPPQLPPLPKSPSPPPIAKAPPPVATKTPPPPPKSPSPPPIAKAPPPKSPSPPIAKAPPPKSPSPPPIAKAPPPVVAPPPVQPPRNRKECFPLCGVRCTNHSRKNVCMRACLACCERCKCVPPGQYGNHEKCGKCYSGMTTRGGKLKCP